MSQPVTESTEVDVFGTSLFDGRLCVVTGGGTGIGLAIARMLYRSGASLALLGRRQEVVEAAQRDIDATGERVVAATCDIREPENVEAVVEKLRADRGPISVLINNAGGQFPSPAEGISPNGFAAVVRNNLQGTWNMTRQVALTSMIPDGGGVIVNIIANVERGFPGMMHTGAARAGVDNMTKSLAVEWARHKIRVNAVAPGYIETEAMSQYPEEIRRDTRRSLPMMRLGTPEEVARTVVFLGCDAAAYVTGETLYVDGGARLWGDLWYIPDPCADPL